MIDSFVLLAPVLLLAVIALLQFVGCELIFPLDFTEPVKFEQAVAAINPDQTAAVSVTLNGVKNGDFLVAIVTGHLGGASANLVSVGDSGNTWTPTATSPATLGNSLRTSIFWAINNQPTGNRTITATFDQVLPADSYEIIVAEYSGVASPDPVDVAFPNASGNSANPQSGSAMNKAGTTIIFGGSHFSDSLATWNGTAGNFILRGSSIVSALYDWINANAGPNQAPNAGNALSAIDEWAALAVSVKR